MGVCSRRGRGNIRCMRELRVMVAVWRGWWQWDVEGRQMVRVDGMAVWAGSTLGWGCMYCGGRAHRWGPWVCNGGARNPLVALGQPEGMSVGQVATQGSSGMERVMAAVWRVARCDGSQTSGRR